jgi:D-sedoheptulose 7-phosphate isomerase
MQQHIEDYWREFILQLEEMPFKAISQAAGLLMGCCKRGSTVFVLGNGGSAATASHFVCDLSKQTRHNNAPLFRVIGLNESIPLLTAWANDVGYSLVFAQQLASLVRPLDVVVMFSTSGDSPNVLAAAKVAREASAICIAFTGSSGGALAQLSDLAIRVPFTRIEHVEDAHLVIAHSLGVALTEQLHAGALELSGGDDE